MSEIKTAIGAGGLIQKNDKVLLVKQKRGSNKTFWMLPGGFVEPGESIENAAIREVLEESGINAEIESVIAVRTGIRIWNGYDQSNIYIVFKMKYVSGKETPDGDETSEVKFLSLKEIEKSNDIVGLSKEIILNYQNESMTKRETTLTVNNQYKEYNLYL